MNYFKHLQVNWSVARLAFTECVAYFIHGLIPRIKPKDRQPVRPKPLSDLVEGDVTIEQSIIFLRMLRNLWWENKNNIRALNVAIRVLEKQVESEVENGERGKENEWRFSEIKIYRD